MKRLMILLTVAVSQVITISQGASVTWDDGDPANHNWSSGQNWVGDVAPGVSDTAVFDDTAVGTSAVDTDFTVASMLVLNTSGAFETIISNGVTLTVNDIEVGVDLIGSDMVITGGTLTVANDWYIGRRLALSVEAQGALTVRDTTVNLDPTTEMHVAYRGESGNNCTGLLNLAEATLVTGTETNVLRIESLNVGGSTAYNQASLRLPSNLKELDVNQMRLGGAKINGLTPACFMDFAAASQLTNFTVNTTCLFYNGYVTQGDGSVTGFPANAILTFGSEGSPIGTAEFGPGIRSTSSAPFLLSGFKGFRSYISDLQIGCRAGDFGNAVLDFLTADPALMAGNFTSDRVDIATLRVGIAGEHGRGLIKLKPSVTNIALNNFFLGDDDLYNDSDVSSVIDLGTNSELSILTTTNDFLVYDGRFQYTDGGGNAITGMPANTTFRVGVSSSQRGTFGFGLNGRRSHSYSTSLGIGIEDFRTYVDTFSVVPGGDSYGNRWVDLDLRGAKRFLVDASGAMKIGTGRRAWVNTYFPAGTATVASLEIGTPESDYFLAWVDARKVRDANLAFSNTLVTVNNDLEIGPWGEVTNNLYGVGNGVDITSTFTPAFTNVYISTNGGKMVLVFNEDTANIADNYWGLRVGGDARALLQEMTNDGRIAWVDTALSPRSKSLFGVHYDSEDDATFVGVVGVPKGTLISLL